MCALCYHYCDSGNLIKHLKKKHGDEIKNKQTTEKKVSNECSRLALSGPRVLRPSDLTAILKRGWDTAIKILKHKVGVIIYDTPEQTEDADDLEVEEADVEEGKFPH